MKKYLLPLLFIALAAVAWWLWRRDTGTTLTGAMSDFAIADTARVDRIFIADKQGRTADLRRGPDGRWTVDGRPANQFPVGTLLKTFRNVEVRTPVPKSAEAATLKFMSTSAVKVEIYTGGSRPEKIWWVGHGTPDHLGVYTILEKPGTGRSASPFVLGMSGFTGLINTRFHANLDEWLSTDMAVYPDINAIASMQVEHPLHQGREGQYPGLGAPPRPHPHHARRAQTTAHVLEEEPLPRRKDHGFRNTDHGRGPHAVREGRHGAGGGAALLVRPDGALLGAGGAMNGH